MDVPPVHMASVVAQSASVLQTGRELAQVAAHWVPSGFDEPFEPQQSWPLQSCGPVHARTSVAAHAAAVVHDGAAALRGAQHTSPPVHVGPMHAAPLPRLTSGLAIASPRAASSEDVASLPPGPPSVPAGVPLSEELHAAANVTLTVARMKARAFFILPIVTSRRQYTGQTARVHDKPHLLKGARQGRGRPRACATRFACARRAPEGAALAVIVLGSELDLAWAHRDALRPMLASKGAPTARASAHR